MLSFIALAVTCFIVWAAVDAAHRRMQRARLPPGPKPLPFIGNLLDMPQNDARKRFTEWKDTYGDVVYAHALGQDIVVLSSFEAAVDLLEKRSAAYSDRPNFEMPRLMGWDESVVMAPYGERWKTYKRLITPAMNKNAAVQYHSLQEQEVVNYLRNLLDRPDQFLEDFRRSAGSTIMSIVYGRAGAPAQGTNSVERDATEPEYVRLARVATTELVRATTPGAYLVELIPLLRHAPRWVPFMKKALQWRADADAMVDKPLEDVEKMRAKGMAPSSFTLSLLEQSVPKSIIRWTSGTMYAAGADTTVAAIATFFLAMTIHPSVQEVAQEELDRVVGRERLPELKDRASLPYVESMVKEVLRWHPVSPIVFRKTSVSDEYGGYVIPEGATLFGNVWAMARDERLYKDASQFHPQRFMDNPNLVDPHDFAFGFGRRTCPGEHLASATIFITIACVLATFEITPERDIEGKAVIPKVEYDFDSSISGPMPFKCQIVPRSKKAANLIRLMHASQA